MCISKFNTKIFTWAGQINVRFFCIFLVRIKKKNGHLFARKLIKNFKINIQIIRKQTKLPLIIDAGLGQASDATIAMELGCDGVLVNTAIAKAKKPFEMALAFKNAVIAGRQSYKSGRIDKILMGNPSSPLKGII